MHNWNQIYHYWTPC